MVSVDPKLFFWTHWLRYSDNGDADGDNDNAGDANGNGADDYMKYAECEIILMIKTSPTSCLTVASYPNDAARQKAVALREGRHRDAVANFLKIEHTLALEGEVTAKRLKEILT